MDLRETKRRLRGEYAALRDALTEEDRKADSFSICLAVTALPAYAAADTLLLYAPIRSEVDVFPLLFRGLLDGKTVGFPRCEDPQTAGGQGVMHFFAVRSEDDLETGRYGVREPKRSCLLLEPSRSATALCLVPGLAFDEKGFRLGYGKGYYDRYLAAFQGVTVGVTFETLRLGSLPKGRFDRPVDLVMTEKAVYDVKAVGSGHADPL